MTPNPRPLDPEKPANPLIETNCPCPRECPRHGNCVACVANHRDVLHSLPNCLKTMMEAKNA